MKDGTTCGALRLLATMNRFAMTKQVVEYDATRSLLELVSDMLKMVADFYHSKYIMCSGIVERVCLGLTLHMYLGRDQYLD